MQGELRLAELVVDLVTVRVRVRVRVTPTLTLTELVVDRDDVVVPERDAEARLLRGGGLGRVRAGARVRVRA